MATNLCMGCMQPLSEGETKCSHCGYPVSGVNPPEYLCVRTVLSGRYLVGRVLEIGGDSAVYIGYDQQEQDIITLREFFPSGLCKRSENGALTPLPEQDDVYAAYRAKFLNVARAVARLREVLVVVPPYDIFTDRGTAYTVSEFCHGTSLEKYVAAKGGRLPFEEVRRLFLPLLSALATIHATGLLHLGISPKNILVDEDGSLHLKNFAIPETRTVNSASKPGLITGYAAPEQYEKGADCTQAADVYGVAASMFFALTGHHPADATTRGKKAEDLMMPAEVSDKTPAHVKESLYRALRVHPQRRTQTVQLLLDEMTATSAVAALIHEDDVAEEEEAAPRKSGLRYLWIIFVAVFAAMAILMVLLLNGLGVIHLGGEGPDIITTQDPNSILVTTTTVSSTLSDMTITVEDLCGKVFADVKKMTLSGQMKVVLKGYEYSDDVEKGKIVSQTPAAGDKAARGTVIEVVISAGSTTGQMPDLTGWKEEHARLYLEALGYKVGESMKLQISDHERGVVDNTSPKAGATIQLGDTITLYVSDVRPPTSSVAQ